MNSNGSPSVLLLCGDLMFRMELKDLLRAHGCVVVAPKKPIDALSDPQRTDYARVLVDLETVGEEMAPFLRELSATPERVLCFFSHRNVGALSRAHSYGIEQVVPRSALHEALSEFLK